MKIFRLPYMTLSPKTATNFDVVFSPNVTVALVSFIIASSILSCMKVPPYVSNFPSVISKTFEVVKLAVAPFNMIICVSDVAIKAIFEVANRYFEDEKEGPKE